MDDLKLIIKYLEEKRSQFLTIADDARGEPDHVYNNQSLQYINQQLTFYKRFRKEYSEGLHLESELQQLKNRTKSERRTLMTKLYNAIDKSSDAESLNSKLIDQIKIHTNRISSLKSEIAKTQEKLNSINYDWQATHKQDLVYELTEAIYDSRLNKYELTIPKSLPLKLVVKGNESHIILSFAPMMSYPYEHVFTTAQETLMTQLAYKNIGGIWTYNFDREADVFDTLITTIARTLLEVIGVVQEDIEVKYEEYE